MLNRETTDKFLSTHEQVKVELFAKDDITKEAIKKILLSVIYSNGVLKKGEPADPLKNATLSLVATKGTELTDAQVGNALKVFWEAVNLLEVAFQQIQTYNKKEFKKQDEKNIAR